MLNFKISTSNGAPCRILCLGAHSDDIEIGCGGTVMQLLRQYQNVSVRWVVFSSCETRAGEAQRSAELFLQHASEKRISVRRYRDGFFPYDGDKIKEEFESIKRDFVPDLVLTHYRDDRHQDHRTISDLTWNTFRNHLILEYEIPKFDGDLGSPNLFVSLDEALCRRKSEILINCFESQREKHWFDEQTFLSILRLRGMEANSPSRFAEAFYCRKSVLS